MTPEDSGFEPTRISSMVAISQVPPFVKDPVLTYFDTHSSLMMEYGMSPRTPERTTNRYKYGPPSVVTHVVFPDGLKNIRTNPEDKSTRYLRGATLISWANNGRR